MPSVFNKWLGLKDDGDHVSKKDSSKNMPTSNAPTGKATTKDLGSGAARNAVEAVRKRRQELDDV
jgi:hypothetical protein